MATILASAILSYALSRIGTALTEETPETPVVDDKPPTTSKRGSYVPRNFGVNRFGATIANVSRRVIRIEDAQSGKGTQPAGGTQQSTYFEDATHYICVSGSNNSLERVYANGEVVLDQLISEENTTSGSTFELEGEDFTADISVYFGEDGQPINPDLAREDKFNIPTRLPNIFRVDIRNARLGGFAQWPGIEYVAGSGPRFTYLTRTSPEAPRGLGPIAGSTNSLIGETFASNTPGSPFIKIPDVDGSVGAFYENNFALVTGQSVSSVNRGYKVSAVVHSPNEDMTINSENFGVEPNLPVPFAAPWVIGGSTLNPSTSQPPNTFAGIILGDPSPDPPNGQGAIGSVAVDLGNTTAFREFRQNQSLRFFVRVSADIVGGSSDSLLEAGFSLPNNRRRTAVLRLSKSGGVNVSSLNNGVSVTLTPTEFGETLGFGNSRRYYEVEVRYTLGSGNAPPVLGENRVITFSLSGGVAAEIWLSEDSYLLEGTTQDFTGVSTIFLDEAVTGIVPELGRVQAGERGGEGSARGLNVAHIVADIIFSPKPWGCGRPLENYSLESLEVLGELIRDEGIRCNLPVANGEKWDAILQALYQNFGFLCRWNTNTGLYEFVALRDSDPIIIIPNKAIQDPLPVHEIATEAGLYDKIAYTFRNRDRNYKEDAIAPSDDRYAQFRNATNQKKEPLIGITDLESARAVSRRRGDLEVAPNGVFKHSILRESRNLKVADRFQIEGNPNFTFRITKITHDVNTSIIVVESLLDSYGYTAEFESTLNARYSGPPPTRNIVPDVQARTFEVPASVSGRSQLVIGFARVRANESVGAARYYTSKDDSSYWLLGSGGGLSAGGVLTQSVNDTDSDITIEYQPTGVDDFNIIRNITSDERDAGTQWAIVNDEIFLVKGFTQIDESTIRLTGIVRDSYGPKESHAIGDEVYIFDPRLTPTFVSNSFVESQNSFFKIVPAGKSNINLASIVPIQKNVSAQKLLT